MRHTYLIIACLITVFSYSEGRADTPEKLKRPIPDYTMESTGLIRSDLQGAFPKSTFKDQPRSEVQYLLETIEADGGNRALQQVKRDFLVSVIDTRLIKNDIKTTHYKDIFALRIKTLMKMGRYQDAFKLYTDNVPVAPTSELAELGLILVLDLKGLPTACLDAKVLAPRFEENAFWRNMMMVCTLELEQDDVEPDFSDSSLLQAVYTDKSYQVPANHTDLLIGLTPLETHILFIKDKISYKAEPLEAIKKAPPHLTRLFFKKGDWSDRALDSLNEKAYNQNLLPTVNKDVELKDVEETSQEELINFVILLLKNGDSVPPDLSKRLKILAGDHPENYVFINILSVLGLTRTDYNVPEERFNDGLIHFTEKSAEKLIFIKSLLDNDGKFSNNRRSIYEKRLKLNDSEVYALPTDFDRSGWDEWQKNASDQGFIGLSFLIALNTNNHKSGDQPLDVMLSIISSLSTVGLIDKARFLAKEVLIQELAVKKAGYKEGE